MSAPTFTTDPSEAPSETFTGPREGVWQMVTETSSYLLNLDEGTATRLPDRGAGQASPGLVYVAAMRRDGEPIPLLAIDHVAVGQRAVLWLQVRDDGVPTERTTTLVCELSRIEPSPV